MKKYDFNALIAQQAQQPRAIDTATRKYSDRYEYALIGNTRDFGRAKPTINPDGSIEFNTSSLYA